MILAMEMLLAVMVWHRGWNAWALFPGFAALIGATLYSATSAALNTPANALYGVAVADTIALAILIAMAVQGRSVPAQRRRDGRNMLLLIGGATTMLLVFCAAGYCTGGSQLWLVLLKRSATLLVGVSFHGVIGWWSIERRVLRFLGVGLANRREWRTSSEDC